MIKYYCFIFILSILLTDSVFSQELMYVEGSQKVVFQGVKIRPGQALKLSDLNCDVAKQHFAKLPNVKAHVQFRIEHNAKQS